MPNTQSQQTSNATIYNTYGKNRDLDRASSVTLTRCARILGQCALTMEKSAVLDGHACPSTPHSGVIVARRQGSPSLAGPKCTLPLPIHKEAILSKELYAAHQSNSV